MALSPPEQALAPRTHRAARIEDAVRGALVRRLRQRGWYISLIAYTGYGAPGWVRVMGRVMLTRLDSRSRRRAEKIRGWRNFVTVPVGEAPVTIHVGDRRHDTVADRGGFIDCVVPGDFAPGWQKVRLSGAAGVEPVDAAIRVVDPTVRLGIVSDIDDTVMVTALPRPMLAAWNTFVLDEHARMAVPGMAVLYERLATAYPGAPVFYLSTGAWNVAATLNRFLSRHLYPAGPLLLTDWGPQKDRFFRSGQEHKRSSLRRLAQEFPDMQWLLVGDDGQHDQELYAEFAEAHPDNVAAVAIRQLSPTQAVLAGAPPLVAESALPVVPTPHRWLSAPDGAGLWRQLRDAGLL
ncbi:MAG TPA: phosphatase domain-containing protein [Catenuloplanes sp.]